MSVDKDNDTWTYNYSKTEITSKKYYYDKAKDSHYTSFRLNLNDNELSIISNYEDNKVVSKYKINFLILDYKIFFYIIKLKHHFKQKEKNNKIKSDMKDFDAVLSRISDNYKSEIRKEKLIKLDN